MKAIFLGILAALFFACTFILNRMMDLDGGSWIWSASLRYFFMVPLLLVIVMARKKVRPLIYEMKRKPGSWILWSTVGFGLFYGPLCFAAAYGPGWLIAGTWMITIVSGSLLAPLFYETVQTAGGPISRRGRIPRDGLLMSLIILLGIIVMQLDHIAKISTKEAVFSIVPLVIASFAYPLGNRKMMQICQGRLDAYQRVLGMTLASMPLWLVLSMIGIISIGLPGKDQVMQTGAVALFSGVIATVLFFAATDLAKGNIHKLGAIEATQSLEVLFAAAGEILFLSTPYPSALAWTGMVLVIIGMVLHSMFSMNKQEASLQKKPA
ncbi:multidrug resistance efflux transporter family protein [Peribacillus sp. SCS-155]|uniref:DMT family transporter n=1 Tax=Peribacillus sedimenti TaxID=3115297 RepID=UPI003905EE3B